MNDLPILQLALDFFSLPLALATAYKGCQEVDVIKIGTPLHKACGKLAVSTIKEPCPDKLIMADFKALDVGSSKAIMAFDANADWMTALGAAPMDTVKLALEEANSRLGKEMFIELTSTGDNMARDREWCGTRLESCSCFP
jgi:3-dehydro-L-gulonate-6-phosphate decarboxylase